MPGRGGNGPLGGGGGFGGGGFGGGGFRGGGGFGGGGFGRGGWGGGGFREGGYRGGYGGRGWGNEWGSVWRPRASWGLPLFFGPRYYRPRYNYGCGCCGFLLSALIGLGMLCINGVLVGMGRQSHPGA